MAEGKKGTIVTANDRFKRQFGDWFWGSMAVAALLHGAMFAFFPKMTSGDVSFSVEELQTVDLPPEVEIPPPPEAISRPATPVVGSANISEDITIAATTFEENPVNNLPPPPTTGGGVMAEDIAKAPTFTPFTVAPRLKNNGEVARALERNYPPLLRDAGIGGEVNVWFFIDEEGKVLKTQVNQSSGYPALDDAAVKVGQMMEFTPAYNRDKKVQVWVSIPIKFNTK
ncbi:MAG: TonB family protein [Gemmatimonadota bacterium]|jgi:protein TonB